MGGQVHGILFAYAAVTRGVHPFCLSGAVGAFGEIRPRRYSGGKQLHIRDVAGCVFAAACWQPLPRILGRP